MAIPSPLSSVPPSPTLTPMDSSTALVLVHDDEEPASPYPDFDEDEEEDAFQFPAPSVAPLSQPAIFIYLLAPLLKLGALLLPNTEFSLRYGLPSFLFFALLSAFARQIWYNLALYVRNPDLEYVILDSLARGRSKERLRSFLRVLIRMGTRALRTLLAAFYLREAVHSLAPLFPAKVAVLEREHAVTLFLAILLQPMSLAPSLGSRRILYATVLSIVTFVVWLCLISAAYARGELQTSRAWLRVGLLWRGMTVTAFAFTSSSTLSLYASTKGAMQVIANPKKHRHSFRILASLSVAVGAALMLPLVFFSAFPRRPEPLYQQGPDLKPWIVVMHAATLLLSVPFLIVTSPPVPLPSRFQRLATTPGFASVSRTFYLVLITAIALAPRAASVVLSDVLMVFALGSTYFLPAVVHVIMHQIKRPLSIVLPTTHTYSPLSSPITSETPLRSTFHEQGASESVGDELLQRKERSLQSKQLRKRIIWDLGVWVLLIPIGGGGIVWMIGELMGGRE